MIWHAHFRNVRYRRAALALAKVRGAGDTVALLGVADLGKKEVQHSSKVHKLKAQLRSRDRKRVPFGHLLPLLGVRQWSRVVPKPLNIIHHKLDPNSLGDSGQPLGVDGTRPLVQVPVHHTTHLSVAVHTNLQEPGGPKGLQWVGQGVLQGQLGTNYLCTDGPLVKDAPSL